MTHAIAEIKLLKKFNSASIVTNVRLFGQQSLPKAIHFFYYRIMLSVQIFIGIIASLILVRAADLVISSVVKLARKFHVSDFSIGFFVLGIATSTPEIFVGINAALDGQPQLSMGNLIGASIVLLSLIIGLNAVIKGEVNFVKTFELKDMLLTSFMIISPSFVLFDGYVSRLDGLLLIVLYVVFYVVMNKRQTFVEHVKNALKSEHNHTLLTYGKFAVGIIIMFITSKFVVESAEFVALSLNIPLVLIGLLILSLGTNLPEFTILFTSIRQKHQAVSIGDFLGSAAANTPILGMVALLYPIEVTSSIKVFFSVGMLFLTLITFNAFFSLDKKITRLEGVALVGIYLFYIATEIFLRNGQ